MQVEFKDGSILRGKKGKLVYYKKYGKTYVRKAPKKSNKQRTGKQVALQNRFSQAIHIYKVVVKNTLMADVWSIAAQGKNMNGYNYFISKNCRSINVTEKYTDLELTHMSAGSLGLPHKLKAEISDHGKLHVRWTPNNDKNSVGKDDDRLYVLFLYDENPFRCKFMDGLMICREDGGCEIDVPNAEQKPESVYCFFGSSDKTRFSPSKYFKLEWK